VGDEARARSVFRLAQARRESPTALWWTAGTIAVLSLLNPIINPAGFTGTDLLHLGVVVVFVVGALLSGRPWMPAAAIPWIVATCATVVVLSFQWEVWVDPTALGVVYILLPMLAFGPFTLSLRVMAVAAVPMLVGYGFALRDWVPGDLARWIAAAVAALLIGAVLLRLRLIGIDELGAATNRQRELATRDSLTGVLNRRGVEERAPSLIALARRQKDVVFAKFVDVDGLKAANDRFGHDFGDEVIRATGEALQDCVRAGDLVGRWGGDEFIVVGVGQPLPPEALAARLRAHLSQSGIDLDRWPAALSIGTATAPAEEADFDALITEADADMYARRRTRRDS
jgi:diguanylate cyclase (GGDEF)-like protein